MTGFIYGGKQACKVQMITELPITVDGWVGVRNIEQMNSPQIINVYTWVTSNNEKKTLKGKSRVVREKMKGLCYICGPTVSMSVTDVIEGSFITETPDFSLIEKTNKQTNKWTNRWQSTLIGSRLNLKNESPGAPRNLTLFGIQREGLLEEATYHFGRTNFISDHNALGTFPGV